MLLATLCRRATTWFGLGLRWFDSDVLLKHASFVGCRLILRRFSLGSPLLHNVVLGVAAREAPLYILLFQFVHGLVARRAHLLHDVGDESLEQLQVHLVVIFVMHLPGPPKV